MLTAVGAAIHKILNELNSVQWLSTIVYLFATKFNAQKTGFYSKLITINIVDFNTSILDLKKLT